jgi:hypothetical protein
VTLSEPLEIDSSDDEGHFEGGKVAIGAEYRSQSEQGFIVGIFDQRAGVLLRKTNINPRLFKVIDAYGNEENDIFDYSEENIQIESGKSKNSKDEDHDFDAL